jgi:hypothetical protein
MRPTHRSVLSVNLLTTASNDLLSVSDVQPTVQLDPTGLQSEVIGFVSGAADDAEGFIATSLRNKLLEPDTQTRLSKLLTKGVRTKFPSVCRLIQARSTSGDYMLHFTTGPQPLLPCV